VRSKLHFTPFHARARACFEPPISLPGHHHLHPYLTSHNYSHHTSHTETDEVATRRRELVDQLSVLNRGISILNEIRDSGIMAAPVSVSNGDPPPPGSTADTTGSDSGAQAVLSSFQPPPGNSPGENDARKFKGGGKGVGSNQGRRGSENSLPSQAPPRLVGL